VADPETLEQMQTCEFDLASAGDLAGAHMMGDLIEGYINGRVPESNARIALASGRNRIRKAQISGSDS